MKKLIASLVLVVFASVWGQVPPYKIGTLYVMTATGTVQALGQGDSPKFAAEKITGNDSIGGVLAVGLSNPASPLFSSEKLEVGNTGVTGFGIRSWGGQTQLDFIRAQGTLASPTQVLGTQVIGALTVSARSDTGFPALNFALNFSALGNQTTTNRGFSVVIDNTDSGSTATSSAAAIFKNHRFLLGTQIDDGVNIFQANGPAKISGDLTVHSTTDFGGLSFQSGSTTSTVALKILNSDNAGQYQLGISGSAYAGAFAPNDFYVYDAKMGAIRVNLNQAGNWSFNSSSDLGYPLAVDGSFGATGSVVSGSNANQLFSDGSFSFGNSNLLGASDGSYMLGNAAGFSIGVNSGEGEVGFVSICGSDIAGSNGSCIQTQGSDYSGGGQGGSVVVNLWNASGAGTTPKFVLNDPNYASGVPLSYNSDQVSHSWAQYGQAFDYYSQSNNLYHADDVQFEIYTPYFRADNGAEVEGAAGLIVDAGLQIAGSDGLLLNSSSSTIVWNGGGASDGTLHYNHLTHQITVVP